MDIERLISSDGVTDHTALLPTKNKSLVDFDKLTDNQRKVLELVYQNLEEATSEPYRYKKTRVTISYCGEVFTATGVQNLELGWKKNRPDETKECIFPEFHKGDRVKIDKVFVEQHQTNPPVSFTDGTLLQAMENAGENSLKHENIYSGIGTVATRAGIIEKLVNDGYVERIGEEGHSKNFVPTDLSYLLDSVLSDSLKSAKLTAEWEAKLSEVEERTLDPKVFLEQIESFIQTSLTNSV